MVFSSMAPFQFNYCHFSFSVSSVWRIEDFFILWYWKIWIVKHRSCQVTYRLTRRLKICALKFSPNEMSFRKWMCQMHWKIFSLNNVMRKFVKFFFFVEIQFYSFNYFSAVLCGLNGFAAFLDENSIQLILSWQRTDIGCYEYFDGTLDAPQNKTKKTKRNANRLDDNCSDHMTGLAMAAFGLFARVAC